MHDPATVHRARRCIATCRRRPRRWPVGSTRSWRNSASRCRARCRRSPTTCPYVVTGNLVVVSGQVPAVDGKIAVTGKVGQRACRSTRGSEAARLCFINVLVHLKAACGGDLDRVKRVVRLGGFIASPPEFTQQAQVMNGASDLAVAVFGEAGRHARTTIGVPALPADAAVEVEGHVRDRLGSFHARRFRHPDADAAPEDRRDPGGRVGCLRRRGQSVRQPRLPERDGGQRLGQCPHRLAAAARGAARRGRAGGRGGADVRQVAQLRRIRVRPRLGARARACRRRLLSEAAGRGAVQPRARARACCVIPMPACRSRRLASALEQACQSLDLSSVHVTFCTEAEWQALGEAGWLQRIGMQFHWENAGYAQLRRLPRRAVVAQAQGAATRAA